MKKFVKQIPNILTTSRLFMVGIFVYAFLNGNPTLSLTMFSLASITDFLDGYLARKLDATSKYGKAVDPVADKLLMGSALLLYGNKNNVLMLVPLIMEGIIALLNAYFITINKDFKINKAKVNQKGRVKTAVLMSTISLALLKNLDLKFLSFLTTEVINSLIAGTTILQTFTIKQYINDQITKEQIKEKSNEDTNDKINYLKKEKESLINNSINNKQKKLTKRKDK